MIVCLTLLRHTRRTLKFSRNKFKLSKLSTLLLIPSFPKVCNSWWFIRTISPGKWLFIPLHKLQQLLRRWQLRTTSWAQCTITNQRPSRFRSFISQTVNLWFSSQLNQLTICLRKLFKSLNSLRSKSHYCPNQSRCSISTRQLRSSRCLQKVFIKVWASASLKLNSHSTRPQWFLKTALQAWT